MKKVLFLVVLALAATPACAWYAVQTDTFSYAAGSLNGQGPWSGSATGEIAVTAAQNVQITSNATAKVDANWTLAAPYSTADGKIYVGFDFAQGAGVAEFFYDVYALDASGKQLGWMYGTVNDATNQGQVRGRFGGTIVTYWFALGDTSAHNFSMVIDTVANTTTYYADGVAMGAALGHDASAANALSTLQLTSWNRGNTSSTGFLDNLAYGATVPEPTSLLALSTLALGALGLVRRRK